MKRPFAGHGVIVLFVAILISGCSMATKTGTAVVEIRSISAGSQGSTQAVSVIGPDNELVDSLTVNSGSTITVEDVPFGWVKVEATALCSVEAEVNSQTPSIRLIIDGSECTLAN